MFLDVSTEMSKDDSLHETAIITYSKAKSISSPTCRKEGEKLTPYFVPMTCLRTFWGRFGVSDHNKQHKASPENKLTVWQNRGKNGK